MRPSARNLVFAFALSLLAGAPGAACAETFKVGALVISRAWAPAAPATAQYVPGYLTITNTGSAPDRLMGGSIVEARHLAIYAPSGGGGMAPAPAIVIPPGETVTLQPGTPHLLFTGLRGAFEQGMQVQSLIKFEKSGSVVLKFDVEAAPATTGAVGKKRGRTAQPPAQ